MMLAGRGIAKVITSGQNTNAQNAPFQWLTNGYVLGIPVVFILALAIVGVVAFVVRRSALGLMIESIGVNPKASRMAGIRPAGILMAVYMLSGLLAGIAGIFAVGSVMTVDVSRTGYQLELDAILAVVIGGTSLAGGKFYIGGAVIGSILIATLDKTIVFLGIPASATPAFKAVVIIALCLLQSQRVRSLFGRRRKSTPPPAPARTRLSRRRKESRHEHHDRIRSRDRAPRRAGRDHAISARQPVDAADPGSRRALRGDARSTVRSPTAASCSSTRCRTC